MFGGNDKAKVKEIAEKVYSTSIDFHNEINTGNKLLTKAPYTIKGYGNEVKYIMKNLNIPYSENDASSQDEYFNYVADSKRDSSKINFVINCPGVNEAITSLPRAFSETLSIKSFATL